MLLRPFELWLSSQYRRPNTDYPLQSFVFFLELVENLKVFKNIL